MQLSLVQYGVQSVFDTPVAATGKLLGKIEVKQDTTVTIPKDDIGLNVPGFRTVKGGKLVTNTIEIARAYYRALPMIFSRASRASSLRSGLSTPTRSVLLLSLYSKLVIKNVVRRFVPPVIRLASG